MGSDSYFEYILTDEREKLIPIFLLILDPKLVDSRVIVFSSTSELELVKITSLWEGVFVRRFGDFRSTALQSTPRLTLNYIGEGYKITFIILLEFIPALSVHHTYVKDESSFISTVRHHM